MNNETPHQKAHRRLSQEILIGDFECVDNCRIALKSDPKEMADYEAARADGCCGFYDQEILVDGEVYLIGCNYGH
jgi:hypothetical protein